MHDYHTKRLPYPSDEQAQRFWAKVRVAEGDACWLWTASLNKYGYGQFGLDRKRRSVRAHRLAFFLYYGADPYPCDILHRCDNRACCYPEHFFLGNRKDNANDRDAKGRTLHGIQLPQAKLTEEKVREIRKRRAAGDSYYSLARDFDLTPSGVYYIVTRHWKHVT